MKREDLSEIVGSLVFLSLLFLTVLLFLSL
jgi:hypothetical protein